MRPAALFGDAPEKVGVVPIRIVLQPGRHELEIRWIPRVDEVHRMP